MIPLERPEKEDFNTCEYIDHISHNTPGDSTSGKYVIKIPRFDSCTPEEWIISMDLVQKVLVGQNITTGSPIYTCIEKVLKSDAKEYFTQQANLVGSCTFKKALKQKKREAYLETTYIRENKCF